MKTFKREKTNLKFYQQLYKDDPIYWNYVELQRAKKELKQLNNYEKMGKRI